MRLTEAGRADPLLAGVDPEFEAFVGHKEAIRTLPEHAEVLVAGEACPVQMFRIGAHQYATQFHPELDLDGLLYRLETYADNGYYDPAEAEELFARCGPPPSPSRARCWRTSGRGTPGPADGGRSPAGSRPVGPSPVRRRDRCPGLG